jgi:hypothetical protein
VAEKVKVEVAVELGLGVVMEVVLQPQVETM